EADRLGGPDEPQPVEDRGGVVAVARHGPVGFGEEPNPLVVAQRLGGHPGCGGDFTDAHRTNIPLDLPPWRKVHHGVMVQPDPTDVRLLYFDDCPNWRVADARLKAALVGMGADPDTVIYEQVTTIEQAEALGFRGSPTILVDGTDPFADPEAPAG